MSDPAVRHAVAQLDMMERVLPGLLATLDLNVRYAYLLRDAAGVTAEQWAALDFEARERVMSKGCSFLRTAARVSNKRWNDMPCNSKQRSDVLLRGAAELGIETRWPGWEA